MYYCKLSCLIFLIFLMLSVICFSCEDPKIIKRHKNNIRSAIRYRAKRKINNYSICMHGMDVAFNGETLPLSCAKHAIHYMKLYGVHRSKYPIHVTLYYQEFHKYLSYDNIILPYDFCFTTEGFLNTNCYRETKIFQNEISQEDILQDYTSEEFKSIPSIDIGFNRGESSSSKSEEQHTSVEPPAEPSEEQLFSDDELQLIQNAFPDFKPGEYASSQSEEQPEEQHPSVEPLAKPYPSVEPPAKPLTKLQIMQFNVLKSALYYHKVGEIPEGVGLTDESRKFFHKEKSYGDYYLQNVMDTIALAIINSKMLPGPGKFCRNLYPFQKKFKILDDPIKF